MALYRRLVRALYNTSRNRPLIALYWQASVVQRQQLHQGCRHAMRFRPPGGRPPKGRLSDEQDEQSIYEAIKKSESELKSISWQEIIQMAEDHNKREDGTDPVEETPKEDNKPAYIVRLNGLPWAWTEKDIMKYLACNVKAVFLCLMADGKPSGEAIVELNSGLDLKKTLNRSGTYMGKHRVMEVIVSDKNQRNRVQRNNINIKKQREYHPEDRSMVRLRGVHYDTTVEEIHQFFHGLEVTSVEFVLKYDKTPSGEAYVEFAEAGMVKGALKRHKEKMRTRYVEVYATNKMSANHAMHKNKDDTSGSAQKGLDRLADMLDKENVNLGELSNLNKEVKDMKIRRKKEFAEYKQKESQSDTKPEGQKDEHPFAKQKFQEPRRGQTQDIPGLTEIRFRLAEARKKYRPGTFALTMVGLPYVVKSDDVMTFFDPVAPLEVEINRDSAGWTTGTAEIFFKSQEDLNESMKKDKEYMGSRYIDLFPHQPVSTNAVYATSTPQTPQVIHMPASSTAESPDSSSMPESGDDVGVFDSKFGSKFRSRRSKRSNTVKRVIEFDKEMLPADERNQNSFRPEASFRDNVQGQMQGYSSSRGSSLRTRITQKDPSSSSSSSKVLPSLHMKGLPHDATEADIYEFFHPLRPSEVEMHVNEYNLSNGTASVCFRNVNEMEAAVERDGQSIGQGGMHGKVKLTVVSKDQPRTQSAAATAAAASPAHANPQPHVPKAWIILMRGIPSWAEEHHVRDFFAPQVPSLIEINEIHQNAHVHFETNANLMQAIKNNSKTMGARPIQLVRLSTNRG